MSKKAIYYDIAEKLYIEELNTIEEISLRLKLSDKTIRNWKNKGEWEDKKKTYLKNKEGATSLTESIRLKILRSIDYDLEREEAIKGIRKKINYEKIELLLKEKEEDLTMKNFIESMEEANFTIRDFIQILKYAWIGDFDVSPARLYFAKGSELKETKCYEDLKSKEEKEKSKIKNEHLAHEDIKYIVSRCLGVEI